MRILPALSSALAALVLVGVPAASASVPDAIAVPSGHRVFDVGHAAGVQMYACNGSAWTFVAPRAVVVTDRLQLISHFAGPTWQHRDGSSVVGRAEASVTVGSGAIPWLRVAAKSTAAGPFGDYLAKTSYIQRINTRGGLAPAATTCTPERAGREAKVPYTADYVFWTPRAS